MCWTSHQQPITWGSPQLQISNWAWPLDRSCSLVNRWEQHQCFSLSHVFVEAVQSDSSELKTHDASPSAAFFLSPQFPELHAMIMRRFSYKGDVDQAWQYVLQVKPVIYSDRPVLNNLSFIINTALKFQINIWMLLHVCHSVSTLNVCTVADELLTLLCCSWTSWLCSIQFPSVSKICCQSAKV